MDAATNEQVYSLSYLVESQEEMENMDLISKDLATGKIHVSVLSQLLWNSNELDNLLSLFSVLRIL